MIEPPEVFVVYCIICESETTHEVNHDGHYHCVGCNNKLSFEEIEEKLFLDFEDRGTIREIPFREQIDY